jgi:hypothetical protein
MANAFGVVLDSASVRRATVEGVPETVIAAIYLLHENSVEAVASKLTPDELLHVVRLVERCPSCYPPGTLDALKRRNSTPAPQPSSVADLRNCTRPQIRRAVGPVGKLRLSLSSLVDHPVPIAD